MSTPVKRTVFAVVAAILMAALSSVFAITLARLTRQYATQDGTTSEVAPLEVAPSDVPAEA